MLSSGVIVRGGGEEKTREEEKERKEKEDTLIKFNGPTLKGGEFQKGQGEPQQGQNHLGICMCKLASE